MELFDVDGAFVFGTKPLEADAYSDCQLVERSGRPVIRVGVVNVPVHRPAMSNLLMVRSFVATEREDYESWFTSRPRTNYSTVGCDLYDRLEAAIVLKKNASLTYRQSSGDLTVVTTKLIDTKTFRSEEFVQLQDRYWLRLDRIHSLNGELQEETCNF